jgi:hypothetical protein
MGRGKDTFAHSFIIKECPNYQSFEDLEIKNLSNYRCE